MNRVVCSVEYGGKKEVHTRLELLRVRRWLKYRTALDAFPPADPSMHTPHLRYDILFLIMHEKNKNLERQRREGALCPEREFPTWIISLGRWMNEFSSFLLNHLTLSQIPPTWGGGEGSECPEMLASVVLEVLDFFAGTQVARTTKKFLDVCLIGWQNGHLNNKTLGCDKYGAVCCRNSFNYLERR